MSGSEPDNTSLEALRTVGLGRRPECCTYCVPSRRCSSLYTQLRASLLTCVQLMSGYLDNRLFKILIICEVDRFFPSPVQELLECLEFMFLGSRVIIKFIKYNHSA